MFFTLWILLIFPVSFYIIYICFVNNHNSFNKQTWLIINYELFTPQCLPYISYWQAPLWKAEHQWPKRGTYTWHEYYMGWWSDSQAAKCIYRKHGIYRNDSWVECPHGFIPDGQRSIVSSSIQPALPLLHLTHIICRRIMHKPFSYRYTFCINIYILY